GFKAVYRSTLGEKQGCGGVIENETGVIISPDSNGDGLYEFDLDCIWTILAPEYAVIQLNFQSMDIEASESSLNCSFDYLEIRDGSTYRDPLIEKLCGKQFPTIIESSENKLFIHFHSDGKVNKAGFRLAYKMINSTCGGSFDVSSITQTIKSPNFPLSYPARSRCTYHFTVEHPWLDRVSFKFTSFDLSCENGDYVEFVSEYSLDEPYRMCGYKPNTKLIGVNKIWMTFSAGNVVRGNRKFSVDVVLMNCNETFDAESGFITNRNYPFDTWNQNCLIHINTSSNSKISLYFYEFSVDWNEKSSNCSAHKMEIYSNTTSIATLCPGALPNPIFTSTNHLTLKLFENTVYKYYIIYSSTTLDSGCGGSITSINGVFTSPGFPAVYKKNAVCVWNIRSLGMHSLTLSFPEFGLNARACETNYLEIFDGLELSEDKKVARYCGRDKPAVHIIEGNTFSVKMVTDSNNDGIGFRAKFVRNKSGFIAKNKVITSFSKPEVRAGSVHLSGL
ncbi:Cubilin-like protein, partial [Leptotrombidium deliense]